ncbi:MAG: CCA tRNA nucleotidyltransferase, partial [Candidatus Paceibacterota bacterium]
MKRDIILPDYVRDFMKVFVNTGFEIYLVGGAVRDLLLEKKTKNFDFTTNATPEKIQKMFEKTHYNNIYGTVTIPVEITDGISDGRTRGVTGTGSPGVGEERLEKLIFEVTPYRREGKYKDFRHPEKIDWAKTLEEDVARRDFTINALAHDGKKLIDYVGGMQDLGKKLVRAVGEPKARFCEDALRLIRAVRIASELGFMIEEHTRAAITRNAPLIQHVSWERVGSEMLKIISSDHPAEGVLFLKNTGLLKLILPELDATFDVAQKSPGRHHIYDVGTHLVETLRNCPSKNTIVRFAALI